MPILFKSGKDSNKSLVSARLEDIMRILENIDGRLVDLQDRIDTIEYVLSDRLPPDILTERKFKEEVQDGEEIVGKIISKVEELSKAKSVRGIIEERLGTPPSIVETRRIEMITGLLIQHGKLNSKELSNHVGLSRTRCNEYFKQMEQIGIVEPVVIGREKFYRLS